MEIIKLSSRAKDREKPNIVIKNNKIPAVIYGKNTKSQPVSIDSKTLKNLIKDRGFYSRILSVELDGTKEKVLPKDIQYHPVTDNVIHIDFMRVQENTKVTVEVPVDFLNRDLCPGVKQGGVLNIVRRLVELRCNANKIPEMLELDLSSSEIGDSLKISEISLPEGVTPVITDRDFVIATLVPPTIEAEPEKPEEEVEGEGETEEKTDGDTDLTKDGAPEVKQETSEAKSDKEKKEDSK